MPWPTMGPANAPPMLLLSGAGGVSMVMCEEAIEADWNGAALGSRDEDEDGVSYLGVPAGEEWV